MSADEQKAMEAPGAGKDKSEVSTGMRVAGAAGGLAMGAILGGIAVAVGALVSEKYGFGWNFPSPLNGAITGAGIGLAVGAIFPKFGAWLLAQIVSSI